MAFYKNLMGAMMLLFSALIVLCNAERHHLMINNNYHVDVDVNTTNNTIQFEIEAVNVTGWVGIGVNKNRTDMVGTDLFVAGVLNGASYSHNYYTPAGGANGRPSVETPGNWNLVSAKETEDKKTSIHVRRALTALTENDTEIKDAPIYVVWAYSETNDDATVHHDQRGSYQVNLITGVAGSGAEIISVGLGTVLLGLVAAVLKY